ncbi:MAG: hypothetical protein CFH03_02261 [Alphaproteobacteria bacterium MarineAlpha3_Bin2]|nr:MAG: hypothetical protein CFH03_02261 [Alphaproteobacteria bacterium MarineAlpha3_Bin2]
MIRRTFRGIVQLLGGLGAGLAIMFMVAAWQLSSGPISLGFLTAHLENAINAGQQNFKLSMKDTILTWAGWDRTLDIRVLEVKVLRPDGSLVGSVPEVSFSLSGQALISGLLAPRSIELFGPRLRVSRNLSGDIGIGFMETEAQSKDFALRLLNQLLAEPDKDNPMSYLTRLEVVSAEITLDDQLLGKSWVTQSANVRLRRDAVGLVGEADLELDIDGRETKFSTTVGYQTSVRRLDVTINFSEVSPAVFSSLYYELGPLRALALPLKGTVTVGMSLDGIIEAANFNLSGGRGVLNLPSPFKQSLPVNGVSLKGIYEGGEDRFDIEEMNIDLGAKGSLLLPVPIGHKMPLASLSLKGRYLGKTGRLEITDIVADLGGPSAKASAVVDGFGGIQDIATANMSIDFKGSIKGVAVDQLDRYWPVALGTDAHRWIMAHFSDGEIHQARAEMQLWLENGGLELVSLDGDMDVSGVSVDYLPPMPKVRNAAAYMKFDEKNFNIFISKGVSETLKLTDASVLISGLDEYDQIANITVAIEGAFGDKLAYLDNDPLRYAQAIGVDPITVKGNAQTELKLNFIVENALTLDGIKVSAKSRVRGLSVAKAVLGRDITGGDVDIQVDKKGMDITGKVNIGDIPATLAWRENFVVNPPFKRRYELKMHIADTRQIAQMGLDVAPFTDRFVQGALDADIRFTILNDIDRRLEIQADITEAALSADAFGWGKRRGTSGEASITVDFKGDKISDVPAFAIAADDLKVRGAVQYGEGKEGLQRIDFEQITYGRTDIKGALISRPDGGWDAGFHGPSFDMTSIWEDLFHNSPEGGNIKDLKLPYLTMAVELGRVWIGQAKSLENISGTFVHQDDLWKTVLLKGEVGENKSFELTIRPGDDGNRNLVMTSSDAGAVMKIMEFYDDMIGGKLEITGRYDDKATGNPLSGNLRVTDYRVTEAPVLTRLLSILALTGILEALEGEGLAFKNLDIPFVLGSGTLEVKDASATGTSLGFTASGTVYTYADIVDMTGTVVPAYAINSVLGIIPILGDLLTGGKKGSGVFAVNYAMSGPTDDPKVQLNPLSALTPGIFRNIFDIFDGSNTGGAEGGL